MAAARRSVHVLRARVTAIPSSLVWTLCWVGSAVGALGLAVFSTLTTHRLWAALATVAYLGAAAVGLRQRRMGPRRRPARAFAGLAPVVVALGGALVLPLLLFVGSGHAQSEVAVIERAGQLLASTGSPYVVPALDVHDYNPYLPGMALFGLPRVVFGGSPLGDARWWLVLAFVAALVAAARVSGRADETRVRPLGVARVSGVDWRVLGGLVATPLVALSAAVGGVDLPVVGFCCLGLAYAARGNTGRAGVALGVAAALKWTAWPVVAVALALLVVRRGAGAASRCAAIAGGITGAAVLPALLVAPHAFVDQVVSFPLGLADAPTPAASPLPGELLAAAGATRVVLLLLVAAVVAMAASLVVRPPQDLRAAAHRAALGLTVAFLLAPATRFGYFVYPLVLVALPYLTVADRRVPTHRLARPHPVGSGSHPRTTNRTPFEYGFSGESHNGSDPRVRVRR